MEIKAKNVLIAGRGISGQGVKTALDGLGVKNRFWDESDDLTNNEEGFDLIVVSPGFKQNHPIFEFARAFEIEIIGEIELGYRLNRGKIVAVTGTNGKTTTVKMIAALLSQKYKTVVCGNVGNSFAELAFKEQYDVAVVEISSFQLETVKTFKPDIAVITNIDEDHLDRHGTMEVYADLKKKICALQDENDNVVLSQDGIALKYLMDFSPRAKVNFTCSRGKINGTYADRGVIYSFGEPIISIDKLPFQNKHDVENFLSAVAVARILKVDKESIERGIKDFKHDKHRISFVKEVGGVKFFDDSKGTNVAATLCALAAMEGSVCLIAGGSDKNATFEKLFSSPKLIKINAIGATANKIRSAAFFNNFGSVEVFADLETAVINAYKSGAQNVLLSPACASFDMFASYVERGERFIEIVEKL